MFIRSHFRSPDVALAPPAIPPVTSERRADDFTARMIAEHGTVENALRAVATRMFAVQDSLATVTSERDTARGQLPKAGDLMLPKAEAAEYAKVVALNLKPDEIVAKVKQADDLQRKDSTRTLADTAKEAGKDHGYDQDGLAAMATAKGLHLEPKDVLVSENGKAITKKVWHVRPASDAAAQLVPVTDYVAKLPAFEQRALAATPVAPVTPVGSPWVPGQVPTPAGGNPNDFTGAYIARRNAPKAQPVAS